jgi:hypothetical protein
MTQTHDPKYIAFLAETYDGDSPGTTEELTGKSPEKIKALDTNADKTELDRIYQLLVNAQNNKSLKFRLQHP